MGFCVTAMRITDHCAGGGGCGRKLSALVLSSEFWFCEDMLNSLEMSGRMENIDQNFTYLQFESSNLCHQK